MPASEEVGRLRAAATRRWRALKQARPGIAHLVAAYRHYQANHGNDLAAAITYFSFLSLFPLVLLGVAVTAFVLASQPDLQHRLFTSIGSNLPGDFGKTVEQAIQVAIDKRAGVGVIGLAGVALAGLGWISNLRTAIDTVWGLPRRQRSFLAAKAADALVLVGLGLGVVVSVGLTAGGTAASGLLLRAVGLDGVTGAGTLTWLLGIALGIAGSMVVFGWLMIRLPDIRVPRRVAVRVTLLAAVGFEVLKLVGTFYIARTAKSPAAAAIGPVVGVLVWIYLVSRYLLFCVAWAATALPSPAGSEPPAHPSVVPVTAGPGRVSAGVSPAAVAAGLLSAGAALGAGSLAAAQRWRSRATDRRRSGR
ncbi:MAG: YihY/virulence factor BrkB family protein [Actinobacteria bacterium]|nr:YihY/virulence factor BrkB family protein [Actinomycetota bacterium]